MLRWLPLLLCCLSLPARAASCVPLYELELKKLLDGSYEILNSPEPDLKEHANLISQIQTRLPCADFEVGPHLWTRYLVSIAVREHYQDGDWEEPLTTVLRLDPEVELPVREGHPLTTYDPAPEPRSRGPLPDGIRINKDGLPLYDNVPLDALHLLQRTNGQDWETLVIEGPASIPSSWMKPPPPPEAVLRAQRRKRAHTVGSIASGAMLAGGVAALIVGIDASSRYVDPTTPDTDRPGLLATNNTAMPVAITLLTVGAVGAGVTWVVPW